MKQTIEAPNAAEAQWIAQNLDRARSLSAVDAGAHMDPALLDRALLAWSSQDDSTRIPPNDVANALGTAFGQHLVDQLGMKWAVVTDEQGADLAVHGMPSDVLVFPTAVVAKRIAADEVLFFERLFAQMATDARRI